MNLSLLFENKFCAYNSLVNSYLSKERGYVLKLMSEQWSLNIHEYCLLVFGLL